MNHSHRVKAIEVWLMVLIGCLHTSKGPEIVRPEFLFVSGLIISFFDKSGFKGTSQYYFLWVMRNTLAPSSECC